MPLTAPSIDDRRYQQWVDELLARVPIHTPEWTNFNQSDPGVTLVQLFAHLAESLLYRANLIPERNRVKFLQLLGVPLAAASQARGLVTIDNERAPLATLTLAADLEVRAGNLPFRTALGLDVLPVEGRVFFKRPLTTVSTELTEYYRLLYASYRKEMPLSPALYESVVLDPAVVEQVDLHADTVDRSLWIALLGRKDDKGTGTDPWKTVRDQLGGRTLNLGLVPALDADAELQLRLTPGGQPQASDPLLFELPRLSASRGVPRDADGRPAPSWRQLGARTDVDLLTTPGVVQVTLPPAADLDVWRDLDPIEAGVGDLPPSLDDSALAERLITWLRVRVAGAARARLLWVGINAVPVAQRERILSEPLAGGDGRPDQVRRLSRAPVLPGSVQVLTREGTETRVWYAIDDLLAAEPEVPATDPRLAPGVPEPVEWTDPDEIRRHTDVFLLDPEAGTLTFGDGLRGRRPAAGAALYATYEVCAGAAGNVAAEAIDGAPELPAGLVVTNPVRTWGGADAERVADGEKQIKRFLQHRDRLVSVADFESIAWRTPGIEFGRIEVLPAFHPDLSPLEPGAAPGAVTLMAIPRRDPGQPDAPRADRLFLNSLCRWLEPRRLVTTELIVRGPVYRAIWISVGIEVAAGWAIAEVVDAVKQRLRVFLAPLSPAAMRGEGYGTQAGTLLGAPQEATARGWPLRTAVRARVLLAEAARVAGVTEVVGCLLAGPTGTEQTEIAMAGLDLPRILGLSVVTGEPLPIAAMRGDVGAGAIGGAAGTGAAEADTLLPVPVVPETCR